MLKLGGGGVRVRDCRGEVESRLGVRLVLFYLAEGAPAILSCRLIFLYASPISRLQISHSQKPPSSQVLLWVEAKLLGSGDVMEQESEKVQGR